ncbi:LysR family transcriptional regulator [Gluconobacter sp.]|uniref:LysR family transcriptional regulator n=1 Tax=Gluconobacter sp. TaxID=1876758 RepID=UPI0039E83FDE
MSKADLNLLHALDILIEVQSVTLAAERLGTSPPSVSRLLARARDMLDDQILVRAGRGLVATERAKELQSGIRHLLAEADTLLNAHAAFDPGGLERRFTIRANDGFTGAFASGLYNILADQAPRATLRFAQEHEFDDEALREGRIDLDIGASRAMGPEVRLQTIFRDHHIALARDNHPIFSTDISPETFAAFPHISVSRRGRSTGPVDEALQKLDLTRHVPLIVPSFLIALSALAGTQLIALVPRHVLPVVRNLGMALRWFDIPLELESVVLAQAWHPRFDADPAHRFLRQCVRTVCQSFPNGFHFMK